MCACTCRSGMPLWGGRGVLHRQGGGAQTGCTNGAGTTKPSWTSASRAGGFAPPHPRAQRTIKSSKNKVRIAASVGHAVRYPINSVPHTPPLIHWVPKIMVRAEVFVGHGIRWTGQLCPPTPSPVWTLPPERATVPTAPGRNGCQMTPPPPPLGTMHKDRSLNFPPQQPHGTRRKYRLRHRGLLGQVTPPSPSWGEGGGWQGGGGLRVRSSVHARAHTHARQATSPKLGVEEACLASRGTRCCAQGSC